MNKKDKKGKKNSKFGIILCLIIFGGIGIYFTFISSNTKKYDEIAFATHIDPNEHEDSDGNTIYSPIYTFKVRGVEFTCKAKTGSSFSPSEKKNKVYYDSKNPENCLVEYEKSTSKVGGIICLAVFALLLYFTLKKEPENNPNEQNYQSNQYNQNNYEMNPEMQQKIDENVIKAEELITKASLIYKRVIIGIVIVVLIISLLIDSALFKQTIKSKGYTETVATLVDQKEDEDSIFDEYIYSFEDKNGKMQEIIVSVSKGGIPEDEVSVKYNENDPGDYYTEGMTMTKSGMIWFGVKIVIMVLLMLLFSSRKALEKIHIS